VADDDEIEIKMDFFLVVKITSRLLKDEKLFFSRFLLVITAYSTLQPQKHAKDSWGEWSSERNKTLFG
jgi:hypothetical protein